MTPTVGDIMREARNYFQYASGSGEWTIDGQCLRGGDGLKPGMWIAVTGSAHSDGVYQLGEGQCIPGSTDETFTGTVWQLAPPAGFLALCDQIAAWCAVQPHDGVIRERFGGYSRELAGSAPGLPLTWQQRFARDLTPYRRMYPGVNIGC